MRRFLAWLFLLSLPWLTTVFAEGEDLVSQHKQLMRTAITSCDVARIQKLVNTPYVDINDAYLQYAIQQNPSVCGTDKWYQTIEKIIDAGADLNGSRIAGRPVLLTPYVRGGDSAAFRATRLLLERGADITFTRPGEYPNLYFAIASWTPTSPLSKDEALLLLDLVHDRHPDVNAQGINGSTPLRMAAWPNPDADLFFKFVNLGGSALVVTQPNHRTILDLLYLSSQGGGVCDVVSQRRGPKSIEDYLISQGVGRSHFDKIAVPCY